MLTVNANNVERSWSYLWIGTLALDSANSVRVPRQSVNVDFSPHVPDPSGGIPPAGYKDIESGVKRLGQNSNFSITSSGNM